MPSTLTLRDETLTGDTQAAWSLEFLTETITVAELIRERVYQDVSDENLRRKIGAGTHQALVSPTETERQLNGPRPTKTIDHKAQVRLAQEAFEQGRFLILVDGKQVERLDDTIAVGPQTDVAFVRMTMLVGG